MRINRKVNSQFRLANLPSINSLPRQGLLLAATLLPALFLWGCAGIVSGKSAADTTPPQTYNISGLITPGSGGSGATIKLSGAASASTTVNGSGAFTFSGLANGTYTLTPSRAGYTFSPTSQNVTVSGANVTTGVNFTATIQTNPTYSISGTITPAAGGNGATVTLGGAASASTTADSSGAFSFSGLANGTYTLTPSRAGYTFSPASQSVTVNGANVASGVNFTATANATYSISGTISPTAGGSGATVTLSGAASASTTANSSGSYAFTGLANGAYTIRPSNTGYTFTPASQPVTVNGASVTGVNFTATAGATYTISGTISPTAGGGGATVKLSGAASASTTANSSGSYTFTGLANGAYTVTPGNTGYAFTPASQSVTVNGTSVTGVNFTATAGAIYSISGTISPTAGGDLAMVTLSGAANASTTANATGNYTFTGLASGVYTVTPSDTGYTYAPVSQAVTVNGASLTGVNFTATAVQTYSVGLTWTASTSTVSGYNVYRGTVNGGPYTLVNTSLIGTLTYTDSTVQNGVTYYYVATAVDSSGNESAYSTPAQAIIP
jgi:hypothetical protein